MTLDLDAFGREVTADERWVPLGLAWEIGPVHPNYGKAVVSASFEAPPWAGELTVWVTGEAELMTLRLSDGWAVNKHYDFTTLQDVHFALAELAELISEGRPPLGAVSTPPESRP